MGLALLLMNYTVSNIIEYRCTKPGMNHVNNIGKHTSNILKLIFSNSQETLLKQEAETNGFQVIINGNKL